MSIIKPFYTWPGSQDKNLNIFKKKMEIILEGLSVAKNCVRPESAPLNQWKTDLKQLHIYL